MKGVLQNKWFNKYSWLALSILLFASSYIFNSNYSDRSSLSKETKIAQDYISTAYSNFLQFTKDTSILTKLLSKTETLDEFKKVASRPYGIFLFSERLGSPPHLQFWSEQLVVPGASLLAKADGEYFQEMSNGLYYAIKKSIKPINNGDSVIAIALTPIESHFFIETDYLPNKLMFSKNADKRVSISLKKTAYPVTAFAGNVLFYLDKSNTGTLPYNDFTTIALKFVALLSLLLFIHLFVEAMARRGRVWRALSFFAITVVCLRAVTYFYPALLNLRQFSFFDPQIYGASAIHRSLGDVLINASLFCWLVLFAWAKLKKNNFRMTHFSGRMKWVLGIVALGLLIFSTFSLSTIIRTLIADSKISFDVSNFFSLDRYTIAGFALLAVLVLAYYYFTQLLYLFIFPLFKGRDLWIYFFICVVGFSYLSYVTVQKSNQEVLFYLPVLLWLLAYTWLLNKRGIFLNNLRINISSTISWLFIFSISIAAIMFTEIRKVEWEKRKRIAERLAFRTDPSSERMMSIAMKYLDNEFLSDNFSRFANPLTSRKIRDSIIQDNYAGYLDKYDTRLYVYDVHGLPLYNEDATDYESLTTILNVQSKQTNIEGLYYYEAAYDKFNYITRRDFLDSTGLMKLGTLFVVSNPKNFSSEALLPELFRRFKGDDPENSPIYSNAVYIDEKLVSPPGNYSFATSLTENELPKNEFELRTNGKYDELWYRASNKKVIVIARNKETVIETITLFSYIFCSFLVLVGFVQLISFLLRVGGDWQGFNRLFQLNIRTQVHTTIIFVSIFSFVIIGIATISFFISRYHRNNTDKLSRTMKIMVNEMEKKLSDHRTFDDVIKIYDSVSSSDLQQLVNEVSDIHGVDVNVYDLQGDLRVSSEANVYTKGVLSKKMDPEAFYHLDRMRQVQHSQEEIIGNFSYLSIYSPVRDDAGDVYGYINIPYFTSKPELEQEISNFLVTIINLNAFIFLIAGLISLLVTNRITRSFSIISDRMKEVNLGKLNETVIWNRNDEIGELVIEYNKMVSKLEKSANALAKSEREGAWREMARQVAHEIKNPLTPMKLSIQYLQKAIQNDHPNVRELSGNVAATLVEQIDHLSKIAADFSQFANIGMANVETFDLHDIIGPLKQLYHLNQNVQILWLPVRAKLMIEADKTQMNRLFTNLLANAVEACKEEELCKIMITEKKTDLSVEIAIKDNGEGIPDEMQENIFVPNFTTKSSGTGLGLAMCKSIVEQSHGSIWFETTHGIGTTFYLQLPLVE